MHSPDEREETCPSQAYPSPQEKGNVENFPRGCMWGRRPLRVWGQSFYLQPCVTLDLHRKRCGSVDWECHGLAWGCSWPNSQCVLVPPWGRPGASSDLVQEELLMPGLWLGALAALLASAASVVWLACSKCFCLCAHWLSFQNDR